MAKTVSEILTKAAERVAIPGQWGKGMHFTMDCCCALEAIVDVSENGPLRHEAIEYLRETLGGVGGIAHWNDATGRTQAEVVAAFREAAELAKQREAA